MAGLRSRLNLIYRKLYSHFGPQHWWPAESAFEVMVGAILTQNTSWPNVEKAISSLKKHRVLEPNRLYRLPDRKLARLIRSAGYYNIKTRRLKAFLDFFIRNYQGKIKNISRVSSAVLRPELLAVKGVGPETADSILLYALNKPVFVVDAYTRRVFSRHKLLKEDAAYDAIQRLFTLNLKQDVRLFNEYHALIVALAKKYCLKSNPRCAVCPLDFC